MPPASSARYFLRCVSTHKAYDERETCTTCPETGDALEVVFDLESISRTLNRQVLRHASLNAAKYLDFYPIQDLSAVISLSEGGTPLYHLQKVGSRVGLPHLYLKNEGANPTGVYKDRGSLVEITKAKELGATAIAVASTGNMAASVAAYSSQAGLPCYVFIPEGTPVGKLSQTLQYGGTLIQVRGGYEDCVRLSEQLASERGMYLAGDYAFRAEGSKSIAFEIIEQMDWKVPDVIICPVGCGTNLAGIGKGFREWFEMGLIEKVPRLIAAQPDGCDTICTSAQQRKPVYTPVDHPRTLASAVGIGVPLDDRKVLQEILYSRGTGMTASDESMLEAQRELSEQESLFVEPSSALPVAILERLVAEGELTADQTVVCIATGTGLKDPTTALQSFSEPQSIEPTYEAVVDALERGFPQKSSSQEVIELSEVPDDLKGFLEQSFSVMIGPEVESFVREEMEFFFSRGKSIQRADLLSILEEATYNLHAPRSPLEIVDWSLQDSLGSQPQGSLSVRLNGASYTASSEGVGPVDALLQALHQIVDGQGSSWPRLKDYSVTVTSSRTNAVVTVRMEMSDPSDLRRIRSVASSPDIIVASLNAFAKGYNILSRSS